MHAARAQQATLISLLVGAAGTPMTNKLRFLREQNVSADLKVPMMPKWGAGHQIMAHLQAAVASVPHHLAHKGLHLEFGVREGHSIRFNAGTFNYTTWHGFDSFQGLPDDERDRGTGSNAWSGGKYSTHGKLPDISCCPNVVLHAGWFNETLPPFLDSPAMARKPIAFMNLDADIYSSSAPLVCLDPACRQLRI